MIVVKVIRRGFITTETKAEYPDATVYTIDDSGNLRIGARGWNTTFAADSWEQVMFYQDKERIIDADLDSGCVHEWTEVGSNPYIPQPFKYCVKCKSIREVSSD